jgi:hypothetical protein
VHGITGRRFLYHGKPIHKKKTNESTLPRAKSQEPLFRALTLTTKSKGAVAGSKSTESKVFDHNQREGECGSSTSPKGNCASRKLIASGTPPLLSHGRLQNPVDWLRHAGAKLREEADYSAARQDASSDRGCRFDQKGESSMIGRDLFNIPYSRWSDTIHLPHGHGQKRFYLPPLGTA